MSSQSVFFSVIIPLYNRERRIISVLQSLKDQTFKNFETIIVDDCSTDASYYVAIGFELNNKTVIRNPVNSERCVTRNNGIAIAKGKYICFLDSDDTFLPQHLQVVHAFILSHQSTKGLIFTNAYLEYESGEIKKREVPIFSQEEKYPYLLKYTPNPARVCVERSILDAIAFDPNIPGIEDLDLWLRIATKYPVYHCPEYTVMYYFHSNMYTLGDTNRYQKELAFFRYMFKKKELKNVLPYKSTSRLLSMCHYHLSIQSYNAGKRWQTVKHAICSFFLYPNGYNGQTNKVLFVNTLYAIPFLGRLAKQVNQLIK